MHESAMMAFFAELKRRRVFRATALYAAAAWVAIQGAATIFPILDVPAWATKLTVVLALAGLPVVITISWLVDIRVDRSTADAAVHSPVKHHGVRRALVLAVLLVGVLISGGFFAWRRSTADAALDRNALAIMPFRVSADARLAYLGEGLVDLLSTKFTGEGGPRALDARTSIAAWRRAGGEASELEPDDAVAAARKLGAAQLLLGAVVGSASNITLSATLIDTRNGRARTQVDDVSGPPDSLPVLVDRLAAKLIVSDAGDDHRIASLTSTSLPALRLFLEGVRLRRSGHYQEAARVLERALVLDSTFGLAAFELARLQGIGNLTVLPATVERAIRLAWAARDRLSERDRLHLEAAVGPNYPRPSSYAEYLHATERALQVLPDRVDVIVLYAGRLRAGTMFGDTTARAKSAQYYERAIAIDSTYSFAYVALARNAAWDGDTAAIRRYARVHVKFDSTGEAAYLMRWLDAATHGDQATLRALRDRFAEVPPNGLGWIANAALLYGVEHR